MTLDAEINLVTWLRAQLDEAERIAQSAVADGPAPPWSVEDDQPYPNMVGSDGATVVDVQSGFAPPAQSVLVHIARHDPARALTEIDAKRRILDLVVRLDEAAEGGGPLLCGGYEEAYWDVACLLALPYADRPGYDEAWRP